MKKSIIIVSHNLGIGGIEKSLLGLLQAIDYAIYDVELFLFCVEGPLLEFIPKQVKILPQDDRYSRIAKPLGNVVKALDYRIAYAKFLAKIDYRKYIKRHGNSVGVNDVALNYLYYRANEYLSPISNKEYDIALSFSDVHFATIDKINAKKKIAWIHTDYMYCTQDYDLCIDMWDAYNYIVAVSEDCRKSYINKYPNLESKVIVVENTLPEPYVESEAKQFVPKEMDRNCTRLLSIGRFSHQKNFDNVPAICRTIRNGGLNVKWYLVGYGGDEPLIRQRIAEAGMEDYVIILGKKENPYPYIAACDLYVQPSRCEGKCVAVREAQMLGKPVVITNYATAASQLEDGVDGAIVPMDIEGCARGIAELLRDPERMKLISENCKARDYSNRTEVEKLYRLLKG